MREPTKEQIVLAVLATAESGVFTPVQIQKLLFLLEKRLWPDLQLGPFFEFEPYDYGPFDAGVYAVLESLEKKGLVEIIREPHLRWNKYRLTPEGVSAGKEVSSSLDPHARDYMLSLSKFVRKLSFAELVGAVYKAYPEMKANSVFSG